MQTPTPLGVGVLDRIGMNPGRSNQRCAMLLLASGTTPSNSIFIAGVPSVWLLPLVLAYTKVFPPLVCHPIEFPPMLAAVVDSAPTDVNYAPTPVR